MEKQTKFTKHDIDQLKMLMVVIGNAKFEVKGDAVLKVGLLIQYIPDLIDKIQGHLAVAGAPKIKKIKEKE